MNPLQKSSFKTMMVHILENTGVYNDICNFYPVVVVWFGLSYLRIEESSPYVSFCIHINGTIGPHTNTMLNITTTSLSAIGKENLKVYIYILIFLHVRFYRR